MFPPAGGDDPAQADMNVPSSSTTMQPTKFAKLLKVVWPLAQGALVGGFGGNWHVPGSGFQAEQALQERNRQYGLQQQELQIRREMLQRQYAADQYRNALEAARTKQADAMAERYAQLAEGQVRTKPQIEDTDAGLMSVDPETAQARPVTNMAPEETGSLPLPGESQVAPLHKTQRALAPERPVVVGEGQELVQPSTGKVVTPARPKTFAPKVPRAADEKKKQQGIAESYADQTLQAFGGDADKAIAFLDQSRNIDPALKAEVRKLIRDMKKPATGRKLPALTDQQMKQMATAPAS